ncbi:hypothetical protein D5S17_00140 [Pseudonocardiaceae bacterium YIM PH 21723]|nr:hypothetical protein D5S17_00140 [Pseudonocardiaceae bacterium YIM PH 21723]
MRAPIALALLLLLSGCTTSSPGTSTKDVTYNPGCGREITAGPGLWDAAAFQGMSRQAAEISVSSLAFDISGCGKRAAIDEFPIDCGSATLISPRVRGEFWGAGAKKVATVRVRLGDAELTEVAVLPEPVMAAELIRSAERETKRCGTSSLVEQDGRLLRAHVRAKGRTHVVSYAGGRLLVLSFPAPTMTDAQIDKLTFSAEQRAAQFG